MRVVQVLVVDDHEPFREAAAAVIGATPGFAVAGVVDSGSCLVNTRWIDHNKAVGLLHWDAGDRRCHDCLVEHLIFRKTLGIDAYPALARFAQAVAGRRCAKRTAYRFDPPPPTA